MATLFTETFTRPNASTIGGSWQITRGSNGGSIVSNSLRWSNFGSPGFGARVNPSLVTIPANQWARMTVLGGGYQWMGIGVRMQENPDLGEQHGYFMWVEGSLRIIKWHAPGSGAYIIATNSSITSQFADGDVLELWAVDEYIGEVFQGVRITGFINGVQVITVLDSETGMFMSGTPGFNNYTEDSSRGIDNFEVGDFVVPSEDVQPVSTVHGVTSNIVDVQQTHVVTVHSTTHGHTSQIADITQNYIVGLISTVHSSLSQIVSTIQNTSVDVLDTLHAHESEIVDSTQDYAVTVANTMHGVISQLIGIVQNSNIVVSSTEHASTSQVIGLITDYLINVSGTVHNVVSQIVDLSQNSAIAVSSTQHAQNSEIVSMISSAVMSVSDTAHATQSTIAAIIQTYVVDVFSTIHSHRSQIVDIDQHYIINVLSTAHQMMSDIVQQPANQVVSVHDALHGMFSRRVSVLADTTYARRIMMVAKDDRIVIITENPKLMIVNV